MRPRWNASVVLVPALLSSQMQWQALLRGMRSHGLSWLLAGVLLGERRYMGGAQIQCLRNVLVESNEGSLAMLRQSAATGAGDNDQQELLRPCRRHGTLCHWSQATLDEVVGGRDGASNKRGGEFHTSVHQLGHVGMFRPYVLVSV